MLYILTPIFCVALLCGAVFSFLKTDNKVTANAAAVPPPTADTITFTQLSAKGHVGTDVAAAYTSFNGGSGVSAGLSGKVVTVSKTKIANAGFGYVAFYSKVTVPAMTEYEIVYKAALTLTKYRNGGSSAVTTCRVQYFGNTFDDPDAADQSATLTIGPHTSTTAYSVGPQLEATKYTASGSTAASGATITMTGTATIPTITYTNDTDQEQDYYAYFGFAATSGQANGSSTANGIDAKANFSSSTIKVTTLVEEPSVDVRTTSYNGEEQDFTFDYDDKRLDVTKWDFTNKKGVTTTTEGNPLDSNAVMSKKDAGTYKLYFDIKSTCGAVWDLDTKDQTTKTVSFTITSEKLTAPSGTVTADYTGSELTVNNAQTVPAWYNNLIYTDPQILTLSPAKVTDANESGYTVTATIVSGGHVWSDSESNSSDARTFTFKVNRKALEVEFDEKNGLQVAKLKDASQVASRDSGDKYPKLVTKYYEAGGSPNNLVDAPTSLGNWVAVAKLENADTCNYSVSGTKPFTSSKKQVAYPKLSASSSTSEEYDGEEHEFTYEGYDSTTMNVPDVPAGAISFNGTILKVKNVGKYKPVFTLKDTDLCEWSGTAPAEVEITAKPIIIEADDENKSDWEKGTATTLKFGIPTALCDGDSTVDLVAEYALNGGEAQSCAVAVDGKTGTVTIGKGFAKGNYVLTVKTAEGANYSGSITHSFEITAKGLSLGCNDIKWNIDGKTHVAEDYDDGKAVFEMEYTGKPLTLQNVKVNFGSASDAPYLEQDGDLTGTFIGAKDVGEYTATFAIKPKSSEETCADGPFTLTIKIVPKKLDFSKAEWEYSDSTDDDGNPVWK
ncbi:MAG: hypothetical protein K2J61_04255, partial [Clostridia bacterium]|nr:hypothetical protein [Clostridia bacterium]